MKLSQNLYRTGALGHQRTGPSKWEFELRGAAKERSENIEPRLWGSLKISPKGWRTLANVLRLN